MPTPAPRPADGVLAPPTPTWRTLALGWPGSLQIRLADLGASWLSCRVPLADGRLREVLLGNDDPQAQARQRAYLGATVGRYANRIAHATVTIDGERHRLLANERGHALHGGPQGFDRRSWRVLRADAHAAVFALHSPEGDQGFPGAVDATVSYVLAEDGLTLEIIFEAAATRPTPLALTNHAYLNLDGDAGDVRWHRLRLAATCYVPVDRELIPLGDMSNVAGTDFDFRDTHVIAERFLSSAQQHLAGGYDHAWLLDEAVQDGRLAAAELHASDASLSARLFTDQPALQVYTGNQLAGEPGRDGAIYGRHAGIALEPGLPPDAPNRPQWPCAQRSIARPGLPYRARMRWQFLPAPVHRQAPMGPP